MVMRPGFAEIVHGWTLISGMDDLTDRIERVEKWMKNNAPLSPTEQATIELMLRCQFARALGDDPTEAG